MTSATEPVVVALNKIGREACESRIKLVDDAVANQDNKISSLVELSYIYSNADKLAAESIVLRSESNKAVRHYDFSKMISEDLRDLFAVYGDQLDPDGKGQSRWGYSSRDGFYIPPVLLPGIGMSMPMAPAFDSNGNRIKNTKTNNPMWTAGYIRSRNDAKYFRATVRTNITRAKGFGPAMVWSGADPEEQDFEWFEKEDGVTSWKHNVIKMALHLRFDGDPTITYNVNNRYGFRQSVELGDLDGWHSYTIEQAPAGGGHKVFRWFIDHELMQEIDTHEIEEATGKTLTVVRNATSPTIDISTNVGASRQQGQPGYAWGTPSYDQPNFGNMITKSLTVEEL